MSSTKFFGRSYVARATGISESTVRDLERRGIINPPHDDTGRRIYTRAEIATIQAYVDQRRDRERHHGG